MAQSDASKPFSFRLPEALVEQVEECAAAMLRLLSDPELSTHLGQSGRERVREHFLLPRLLMEELRLLATLDTGGA